MSQPLTDSFQRVDSRISKTGKKRRIPWGAPSSLIFFTNNSPQVSPIFTIACLQVVSLGELT